MSNRSRTMKRALGAGFAAALCLAGAHSVSALGGNGLYPFGGEFRGMTRVTGHVLCSPCTLKDMSEATVAPHQGLYEFTYKGQPTVFAVTAIGDFDGGRDTSQEAYWRAITGLSHQVSVRAEDSLWQQLVAESNRKKPLLLTGLLRSTGTLDIAEATFLENTENAEPHS